jgi:IS5 family transposase
MQPTKKKTASQDSLFRDRLENILNRHHELYRLAHQIDWKMFDGEFGNLYAPDKGRRGIPIRLMVGLTYLQHAFDLSDEQVVSSWVENPYWQYFCGETYFQHELPIDPSSMTNWRKRIGEEGSELLLKEKDAVKSWNLKRVTVDTTVQEKAVALPTDSRLYNRARERLVKLAYDHGIPLRQSYKRLGKQKLLAASRYSHARQMKRARRAVRKLKTYLGRVYRDIQRKLEEAPSLKPHFAESLFLAERVLSQERHDKKKLYSFHASEVECIAKGKAHKKYEFGVKVGVAVTNKDNFVVGMMALPGNPYDGHTLGSMLSQVTRLTGRNLERCYVDKGYRGHKLKKPFVVMPGRKRGVTATIRKELKRRNAIEPIIGHMKEDGKLNRNYLKGTFGDKINAILCGAGHNIRIILRKLRELRDFFLFYFQLFVFMPEKSSNRRLVTAA